MKRRKTKSGKGGAAVRVQRHCSALGQKLVQDTIAANAGCASILSEICPEAKAIIRVCDQAAKRLRALSPNA